MDDLKEKLSNLLSEYFGIGDSYAYNLTRDKAAFGIGTMTMDDFEEFDADTISDIVEYLVANGVTVQQWIPVTERLPEEREDSTEGEKHMVSDIVQVSVQDSLNNKFVSDDMLFDGSWVNYPWGDFEITHWKPLPEPAKEEGDG